MSQDERRVLIIENDPQTPKYLMSWMNEVASSLNPPIKLHFTSIVRNHTEEFRAWFETQYPTHSTGDNTFHFLIMDIMFLAKDGVKQDRGGYELWNYMKNNGIDDNFDHVILVSNGHESASLFASDRDRVFSIAKNRRIFMSLFKKLLKKIM